MINVKNNSIGSIELINKGSEEEHQCQVKSVLNTFSKEKYSKLIYQGFGVIKLITE